MNYKTFRSHPGSYILELDNRPRMGEERDFSDIFISIGPDLGIPFSDVGQNPEQAWLGQEDEWIWLVEFLAEDPFFKENLFYRLTELQPISNTYGYRFRHPIRSLFWSRSSAENIFTDTAVGYEIDSGGQYRMNLSLAFAGPPPDQARQDKLILESSDLIDIYPTDFNLGFRTDQRSIIVNPTSVGSHNYSALEIGIDSGENSYIAPRLDIRFDLSPTLTRKIGVPLLLILGVMAVVISGSVAGPISDFASQQIPRMSPDEGDINLLLTLFGLTLTTVGFRLQGSE